MNYLEELLFDLTRSGIILQIMERFGEPNVSLSYHGYTAFCNYSQPTDIARALDICKSRMRNYLESTYIPVPPALL